MCSPFIIFFKVFITGAKHPTSVVEKSIEDAGLVENSLHHEVMSEHFALQHSSVHTTTATDRSSLVDPGVFFNTMSGSNNLSDAETIGEAYPLSSKTPIVEHRSLLPPPPDREPIGLLRWEIQGGDGKSRRGFVIGKRDVQGLKAESKAAAWIRKHLGDFFIDKD